MCNMVGSRCRERLSKWAHRLRRDRGRLLARLRRFVLQRHQRLAVPPRRRGGLVEPGGAAVDAQRAGPAGRRCRSRGPRMAWLAVVCGCLRILRRRLGEVGSHSGSRRRGSVACLGYRAHRRRRRRSGKNPRRWHLASCADSAAGGSFPPHCRSLAADGHAGLLDARHRFPVLRRSCTLCTPCMGCSSSAGFAVGHPHDGPRVLLSSLDPRCCGVGSHDGSEAGVPGSGSGICTVDSIHCTSVCVGLVGTAAEDWRWARNHRVGVRWA
mmetsp:Transcript_69946/g.227696  ORF Transcript_69946/g.227696 Transcript_69946/m.227696 type:complete len:268 (-) Transcript_69946:771-1574(-)